MNHFTHNLCSLLCFTVALVKQDNIKLFDILGSFIMLVGRYSMRKINRFSKTQSQSNEKTNVFFAIG